MCLSHAGKGFANHYRQLASDTYYIKLDDDIVYIKEGAIEAMLHEKLKSRFWIISANVINHSGAFCILRPTLNIWHRMSSIIYLLQSSLFGSQDTVVSLFCKQHHTSAQCFMPHQHVTQQRLLNCVCHEYKIVIYFSAGSGCIQSNFLDMTCYVSCSPDFCACCHGRNANLPSRR